MASLLPVEILDRIFISLLDRRGQFYDRSDLESVSFVCQAWRGPAQKLIQGNRVIRSLTGIQQLIHVAGLYPLNLRTLFLILEGPSLRHDIVYNEHAWYFLPYVQDLRELYIDVRRWYSYEDPLEQVIDGAPHLRTLKITQFPTIDELYEHAERHGALFFAEMPFMLQNCLANKKHLRHLSLSQVALSVTFSTATAPATNEELPTVLFRLCRLTLAGVIINDAEFEWLMSSQVDSLRTLALCRIAGVTKEVFEEAVVKVAPRLTQLCLNVLPYYIPPDFPPERRYMGEDRSGEFEKLPLTLLEGVPFPRHSLMGSSRRILENARNLKVLQLRDPQAKSSWLAPLDQLQEFEVCLSPFDSQPVDLQQFRTKTLLPKLERLTIRFNDNLDRDSPRALRKEAESGKALPFTISILGSGNGLIAILWHQELGWQESLDSYDELARIWDL